MPSHITKVDIENIFKFLLTEATDAKESFSLI